MSFRTESTLAGYARAAVDLRIRMSEYVPSTAAHEYLTTYLTALRDRRAPAGRDHDFADVISGAQTMTEMAWSTADTYVIAPAMTAIVAAAAQALDLTDDLLTVDAAPSEHGILFLPEPIFHRALDGQLLGIDAITWSTVALDTGTDTGTGTGTVWMICGWYDPLDPDVAFWQDVTAGPRIGPLMLGDIGFLPIGTPIGPYHPGHIDEPDQNWETAPDGRYVITQAAARARVVTAIAYTFWRLQDQPLTTVARPPLDRAARRRAQKANVNPEVRFILLRRTSTAGDPGGEPKWHYRVRFVVRGHWRRRTTPDGASTRTWINAYIKGPDGAPLIHGEKVNILAR